MGKYQDEVELVMSARNEQIAELRRTEAAAREAQQRELRRQREAEKQAKDHTDRMAGVMEQGIVKAALRATTAFAGMQLALGGANAVAKALSGNIEDAAAAVEKLPVIGGFARELKDVLGELTGIKGEIEAINSASANMAEASGRRMKATLADLRDQEQALTRIRALQQDTILRGMVDPDRSRQAEVFRAGNAISSLQDQIAELNRKRTELSNTKALNDEQEKRRQQVADDIAQLEAARNRAIAKENGQVFANPEDNPVVKRYDAQIKAAQFELNTFKELEDARIRELENVARQIERVEQEITETQRNNAARRIEVTRKRQEEIEKQRKASAEAAMKERQDRIRAADERVRQADQAMEEFRAREERERRSQERRVRDDPRILQEQEKISEAERSATFDRQVQSREDKIAANLEKQIEQGRMILEELRNQSRTLAEGPRVVGGLFRN